MGIAHKRLDGAEVSIAEAYGDPKKGKKGKSLESAG
jgi:hypothetical protein